MSKRYVPPENLPDYSSKEEETEWMPLERMMIAFGEARNKDPFPFELLVGAHTPQYIEVYISLEDSYNVADDLTPDQLAEALLLYFDRLKSFYAWLEKHGFRYDKSLRTLASGQRVGTGEGVKILAFPPTTKVA